MTLDGTALKTTRKIDNLGRLTIPQEMRKQLDLHPNIFVTLSMDTSGIITVYRGKEEKIYTDEIFFFVEELSKTLKKSVLLCHSKSKTSYLISQNGSIETNIDIDNHQVNNMIFIKSVPYLHTGDEKIFPLKPPQNKFLLFTVPLIGKETQFCQGTQFGTIAILQDDDDDTPVQQPDLQSTQLTANMIVQRY